MSTLIPGEQGVLLAGAGGRKNLQVLGEGRSDGEGTLHLETSKALKQRFSTDEIRVSTTSPGHQVIQPLQG